MITSRALIPRFYVMLIPFLPRVHMSLAHPVLQRLFRNEFANPIGISLRWPSCLY